MFISIAMNFFVALSFRPTTSYFKSCFKGHMCLIARTLATTLSSTNNIYDISENDLMKYAQDHGQPKFRAQQIRNWIYKRGSVSFQTMQDIPEAFRNKLTNDFSFGALKIAFEQISKDGTCKRAYKLHDGQLIESVLMPYEDGRRTACISSQAGCAMGCVFCATGQMGFARQLTSTEIFEQAQKFSAELILKGERLSNVVLMGMGEPLANYNNVMQAVRRINDELGIGARHITLSTSGIAPRIRQLAEENIQVGLAVSLHQTKDSTRDALMPINKIYPISELLDACEYYIQRTHRRVTFEWALIRNQTDTPSTAHELGSLLKGMLCHVNVIPLNPTEGFGGKPTSKEGVLEFVRILSTYGVPATPRTRRGIDINAGCGQLKADLLRKQTTNKATVGGEGNATATVASAANRTATVSSSLVAADSEQAVNSGCATSVHPSAIRLPPVASSISIEHLYLEDDSIVKF